MIRRFVDAVRDGVCVVGADGRIVHANEAFHRIVLASEAVTGRAVGDVVELEDSLSAGRRSARLRRADGTAVSVRLDVIDDGPATVLVVHEGSHERLLELERMPDSAIHEATAAIAEALDAYLFSGELLPDGFFVASYRGPGGLALIGGDPPADDLDLVWDANVHPDDYPAWDDAYVEASRTLGVPVEVEYRLRGVDGVTRWIRERIIARPASGGRVLVDGVALDVTRERAASAGFARIFALSSELIVGYGRDMVIRIVNPAVKALLGYEVDEVVGAEWALIVHPDDREAGYAAGAADFAGERATPVTVRVRTKAGETRWFAWTGAYDDEEDMMLYVGRDVTGDVQHRDEIERQSRTDALTGLHNRRHLVEALTAELGRGEREGTTPGVLLIDLDRFKAVNDTHGHGAGDAVLVEVGRRLRRAIRSYDVVGRWGGEEFCVILPSIAAETDLAARAEALRAAISSAPVGAGAELMLTVTASAGGVVARPGLWSVEGLIDAADRALYSAKRRGRDQVRTFSDLTVEDLVAEEPEAIRLAQALALSAGVREGVGEGHCEQVADLSARIAAQLGLDEAMVMRCRLAGWLHDLGKIAIPDAVLTKPGALDDDEWAVMRTHAAVGEGIVRRVAGLADAAPAVRSHHERYDGTGYPDGLVGEAIPLEARVVACADAYSAITVDRVYRDARPHAEAVAELRRSAGSHLDPIVVEALVEALGDAALAFERR
jgi:diguanylate cyclase (GGDEF)-like protein/PAS domain S-box-containing protein